MKLRELAIVLILGISGACLVNRCAQADEVRSARADSTVGTLHGQVLAEGKPAGFANVIVLGTRRGTQSDVTGHYTVSLVPVGKQLLRILLSGCSPTTREIDVHEGDNQLSPIDLGARVNQLGWLRDMPLPRSEPEYTSLPRNTCDSSNADSRTAPEIAAIGRVSIKDWQWVGGSIFDIPLPRPFHRPQKRGFGIDSEVGQWEDSGKKVTYELGQYTAHTEYGVGYTHQEECLGGERAQVAIFQRPEPPKYWVEVYFADLGLGLYGASRKASDRAILLTAFRGIRFHDRRPRNGGKEER